ncbi:hypothetical protein SLEP1_g22755 [Rubroshorea leprosula]|uniref:Uncharacterized protein n=1 Tax=Rubroshorea leprosula TaxID=152421 RepID=A0AAV5JA54_9ROSI|nr:hypothetical protein SLEP1_g22755 [Rubroshorea leprosula]
MKSNELRPYISRHSYASWFQVVTPELPGSRSSLLSFLVFQVVTPELPGFRSSPQFPGSGHGDPEPPISLQLRL